MDLTTKTFDVLEFLIENAGKVVTKDEILGHVWNGNFVEESNLPVHISKLRRFLSESRDCRFIETVQGTGYRFVAPLQTVDDDEWQAASSATRGFPLVQSVTDIKASHSIAVLPLQNEGGDPEMEYLVDGLTEGLINGLSHVPGLRVIARNTVFRVDDTNLALKKLGELLEVSHVLTGRVRISGEEFVVSVELTRAGDETQVWGRRYCLVVADLMRVQEEVVFSVVESLTSSKIRTSRFPANSLTQDAESYRLYLKGRYFLEKHSSNDIYKAVDLFNESVLADPRNIFSHVEKVECYRSLHAYGYISYEDFLQLTKPILDAIAIGNQSLDVVQILYCDLKMLEWKFSEAERYCRRALAINTNCLKGRFRYSDILLQRRDFSAALEQLERIMIIDPLSPLIYKRIGRLFYMMGEYDKAIAFLNDALELEPGNYESLALRGVVHTELAHFREALKDFEESLRAQHHAETIAMTGVVYARQGNRAKALEMLKKLQSELTINTGHSTNLAHLFLALGDKTEAYECLERSYAQHEPDLRALTYDRRWIPVRNEARFKSLVKRVGLPKIERN